MPAGRGVVRAAAWTWLALGPARAAGGAAAPAERLPEACDHAVVGAGPAGVYYAWRLAMDLGTGVNVTICVFEQLLRVGGRVASLTRSGPKGDLVVEPGAYRFAREKFCVTVDGHHGCVWTPVTAGIIDALGLEYRRYDWNTSDPIDHNLYKLTDPEGHDIGYAQFVWGMLRQAREEAERRGFHVRVFLGASLQRLRAPAAPRAPSGGASPSEPLVLSFAARGGAADVAVRQSAMLNLPQQPLLQVLGASAELASAAGAPGPPAELHRPNPAGYLKLYAHYSDAWWRGGRWGRRPLNLTSGHFSNLPQAARTLYPGVDSMHVFPGIQAPAPLRGAYHDGDVRCERLPGMSKEHCRGYIQAHYSDDFFSLMFYRSFGLLGFGDAVVNVSRSSHGAAGGWLLDEVHAALVALHAEELGADQADRVLRGEATRPDHAVLSIWDAGAKGFGAACHFSRLEPDGSQPDPLQVPRGVLQPLRARGEPRVFVASEAFGPVQCWGEGALQMAENALQRRGLARPPWMPEAIYQDVVFSDRGGGGGFAERHGLAPQLGVAPSAPAACAGGGGEAPGLVV